MSSSSSSQDDKRTKIETLFYQLKDGCGDASCDNVYCGKPDIDINEAAATALRLYQDENVRICISRQRINQVSSTSGAAGGGDESSVVENNQNVVDTPNDDCTEELNEDELMDYIVCRRLAEEEEEMETSLQIQSTCPPNGLNTSNSVGDCSNSTSKLEHKDIPAHVKAKSVIEIENEEYLHRQAEGYKIIHRLMNFDESLSFDTLRVAFTTIYGEVLSASNLFVPEKERVTRQTMVRNRRDLRTIVTPYHECQTRAICGEDCARHSCQKSDFRFGIMSPFFTPTCDMQQVARLNTAIQWYTEKHCAESATAIECVILEAMKENLTYLLKSELNFLRHIHLNSNALNIFPLFLENIAMLNPAALEIVIPPYCNVLVHLPLEAQQRLVEFWKGLTPERLLNFVELFQQQLVYRVLMKEYTEENTFHNDHMIHIMVKALHLLYLASVVGGEMKKVVDTVANNKSREMLERYAANHNNQDEEFRYLWVHPLARRMNIDRLDSIKPLIPPHHFVNHEVNKLLDVMADYNNSRTHDTGEIFSFISYSFFLTLPNKIHYLFCDVQKRMTILRQYSRLSAYLGSSLISQTLKIRVRRDNIINDTLLQLELHTDGMENFNKQLHVEFEGEEGVDEGGLSKEFFMIIVEKMLTPDHGVFIYEQDSRLFWFNMHSFESESQYRLIGIILGLAINNSCILNISFPRFVYKKLLGYKAVFQDMQQLYPVLYSSIKQLLEYDGNVEEDLILTFTVEYSDVFGIRHTHELKPDQPGLVVTNENRQEYVELYTDWLLNTSVTEQFNAFRCGFDLVCSSTPIKFLFNAEELELLICGKESLELEELEKTARYDGFTEDCQTVKDFWAIVSELSADERKKFLVFFTGCDRVPVGGLADLKMSLVRNGDKMDSLPTAHTCFNVILLPDYNNKVLLKERLLKAISYSEGFGLL